MIIISDNIQIKFVNSWNEDDIVDLYKLGGWWKNSYKKSEINSLISSSYVFAIVYDTKIKKAVGMGRVISDGRSDAYIQDTIIKPDYRNKGIGKKLVKKLIEYCLESGIRWIGLISEPGSEKFYQNIGFKVMKNYTPMIYKVEE